MTTGRQPDPNRQNREPDFEQSIRGREAAPDEVAYRDGYTEGRAAASGTPIREHHHYRETVRDSGSTVGGILLGIVLTVAVAAIAGVAYVVGQNNQPADPASPQDSSDPNAAAGTQDDAPSLPEIPNVEVPNITLPEVNITIPGLGSEEGASGEGADGNASDSEEANQSEADAPAESADSEPSN